MIFKPINIDKYFYIIPLDFDYENLKHTVLHSLYIYEDIEIPIIYNNQEIKLYIPKTNLSALMPTEIYDSVTYEYIGLQIRLTNVQVFINQILVALDNDNEVDIGGLIYTYSIEIQKHIEKHVLSSRVSPGIQGFLVGGDSFLKPGQVAITKRFARRLIISSIRNLAKKDIYKATFISKQYQKYGEGILSGMPGWICKREPATVYGAVKEYTLEVVDCPGHVIYITTPDVDGAGGKLKIS